VRVPLALAALPLPAAPAEAASPRLPGAPRCPVFPPDDALRLRGRVRGSDLDVVAPSS